MPELTREDQEGQESPMPSENRQMRVAAGRSLTAQQRRLLLDRVRERVADVAEDVEATATALRAVDDSARPLTARGESALPLLPADQRRHRQELAGLARAYESLAFRAVGAGAGFDPDRVGAGQRAA